MQLSSSTRTPLVVTPWMTGNVAPRLKSRTVICSSSRPGVWRNISANSFCIRRITHLQHGSGALQAPHAGQLSLLPLQEHCDMHEQFLSSQQTPSVSSASAVTTTTSLLFNYIYTTKLPTFFIVISTRDLTWLCIYNYIAWSSHQLKETYQTTIRLCHTRLLSTATAVFS